MESSEEEEDDEEEDEEEDEDEDESVGGGKKGFKRADKSKGRRRRPADSLRHPSLDAPADPDEDGEDSFR